MAVLVKFSVLFCVFTALASMRFVSSSSLSASTCNPQSNPFVHDLQLQCPLEISLISPIEMDGESLDKALKSSPVNACTVVLFYASWCPFSSGIRSMFVVLSTMFPQIKHLMVEQSAALPSVFSRYGIHSLPSILIFNQTTRARYNGPKDLHTLVRFYKRTTGLSPVVDLTEDLTSYFESGQPVLQPQIVTSFKDTLTREPYLVFSVLFLFLKALLCFFPKISNFLMAMWVAYTPHLKVGIFGESNQILGRITHLIDMKPIWSKLKLCKNRNIREGARRSAQVWASSLASVSLGETSSPQPFSSGDS